MGRVGVWVIGYSIYVMNRIIDRETNEDGYYYNG